MFFLAPLWAFSRVFDWEPNQDKISTDERVSKYTLWHSEDPKKWDRGLAYWRALAVRTLIYVIV